MTAESGAEAVANGRAITRYDPPGYCLKYVREPCWEVAGLYASAIDAWNGARFKHPGDRNPPNGAPCFYRGGQYGHAVISVGGGRIRSTDCQSSTLVNDAALSWPETAWGYDYLGWTEDLNGVTVPINPEPPPEEDPMPEMVFTSSTGIEINDDEFHPIAWDKVNRDTTGKAATEGDPGIRLGGAAYVATLSAEVDVAHDEGQTCKTRYLEGTVEDGWEVVETGKNLEHVLTSGVTLIQDTRTGLCGADHRLRWQLALPGPGRVNSVRLDVLYWIP